MPKVVFEIDGEAFDSLEGFFAAISEAMGTAPYGRNLDSLNDVLRGGFGTPDAGFVLCWRSSELSRVRLGYPETIARLERLLQTCHPANRDRIGEELARARRHEGPTVFDQLVELLRDHGPGGEEADSGVELELL